VSRWDGIVTTYLKDLAVRGFAIRSRETYGQDLAVFVDYLEASQIDHPTDITLDVLRAYQTYLHEKPGLHTARLSLGTQTRYLSVVRSFCGFLCRRSLTLMDASRGLVLPKVQRHLPSVILTTHEVLRFLKAIDTRTPLGIRDRAIFETFYSTGLRVGELVALIPADVDLAEGFLRVRRGKGGKARVVPLGDAAVHWIKRYLDTGRKGFSPAAPLFLSSVRQQMMDRATLSQLVRRVARRAGLKKRVTCHTFRHTCATHMLRGRASLRHIQELLGHANATTTQIYTHVEILDLKRVHRRCHPRSQRRRPR
jgi:integrase/recombinase XerD